MDLGIETGVCRGPLSPFTVGCVRRGGIDADITASEMAAGRKPIKGKGDLQCKSFSGQHFDDGGRKTRETEKGPIKGEVDKKGQEREKEQETKTFGTSSVN